jgi:putative transposase
MNELFLDLYKQESTRLKYHDYASPGIYFITILTKPRILFFGKIVNQKMELSPLGKIVHTNWIKIAKKFSHISLDEFVIMPDHVHGLLTINDIQSDKRNFYYDQQLSKRGGITGRLNPMNNKLSISYAIRWFKACCTYQIRKEYPEKQFAWQSRYFDRIIRDVDALYAVRNYIRKNPTKK